MRKGLYVWLVGPDGSGKSTLTRAVAEKLNAEVRYWRPGTLPMAGAVAGRRVEEGVNSRPHDLQANNRLKATARVAWYFADYLLGYLVAIRPTTRRGRTFIIERGWGDMVVDFRRYGLRSPRLPLLLLRLMPQPDVVFVVSVPPATARERKPELPEDEIRRQYEEWHALPMRSSKAVIDNRLPIAVGVDTVCAILNEAGT